VQAVVNWFGGEFMLDDKRAAFRVELEKVVRRDLSEWSADRLYQLYIDYDPNEPLLEALCNAGVECSGSFSSRRRTSFATARLGSTSSAAAPR
jgi:hypothetical protein